VRAHDGLGDEMGFQVVRAASFSESVLATGQRRVPVIDKPGGR
jgi:hypothetical protein